MPRRWLVGPWFVVFLVVLAGIAIYAARPGSADGSTAPPSKAHKMPKVMLSQAAKPPSLGPSEQLPAIRWYRNEIHNTAVEVCMRSGDQCSEILTLLKNALQNLPGPTVQCRWECPPGDCGPDCHPRQRAVPFSDSIPQDRRLAAIGWYANAIENSAVERDSSADSFAKIREVLRRTLVSVVEVKSKIK